MNKIQPSKKKAVKTSQRKTPRTKAAIDIRIQHFTVIRDQKSHALAVKPAMGLAAKAAKRGASVTNAWICVAER